MYYLSMNGEWKKETIAEEDNKGNDSEQSRSGSSTTNGCLRTGCRIGRAGRRIGKRLMRIINWKRPERHSSDEDPTSPPTDLPVSTKKGVEDVNVGHEVSSTGRWKRRPRGELL